MKHLEARCTRLDHRVFVRELYMKTAYVTTTMDALRGGTLRKRLTTLAAQGPTMCTMYFRLMDVKHALVDRPTTIPTICVMSDGRT